MPESLDLNVLWNQALLFIPKVAGVIVFLLLALWIGGALKSYTIRRLTASEFDPALTKFFGGMVRISIIALALIACLGVFGIETTSFAAILAGAGLAIGLAFQGTLSNFSAGVMLLTFRPFTVGDVVNAAGVVGKVDEIGLFVTTMDTVDNRRIIVPNGSLFGATIENITYHATRRTDVAVGTDYSADLDATRTVLEGVFAKVDGILLEPAPQVYLDSLGDSSINWSVRAWCKAGDFWGVKEKLTRQVKMDLDAAGIGIPFPQMDVHLDKLD
ncbi:MAG: mechanosensitive ion channel domain-containing protein [Bacteroidota bacterium]